MSQTLTCEQCPARNWSAVERQEYVVSIALMVVVPLALPFCSSVWTWSLQVLGWWWWWCWWCENHRPFLGQTLASAYSLMPVDLGSSSGKFHFVGSCYMEDLKMMRNMCFFNVKIRLLQSSRSRLSHLSGTSARKLASLYEVYILGHSTSHKLHPKL